MKGVVFMRGPIDYIVVGFDGNRFDGSILEQLHLAEESGTIRTLAIGLIAKDSSGNVLSIEASDLGDEVVSALAAVKSVDNSLITDEDVEEVGEILENNTSAGLLIIEHIWAKGLKKAIIDAGGFLVLDGRIHPDAAKELED
jgi:hypothetical protein